MPIQKRKKSEKKVRNPWVEAGKTWCKLFDDLKVFDIITLETNKNKTYLIGRLK